MSTFAIQEVKMTDQPDRKEIIAKHNDLIPILAKFGLQELRLMAFCLSLIDSQKDEDFYRITFSVARMGEVFDINTNDIYAVAKQTAISINQKPAEFDDKDKTRLSFWFTDLEYHKGAGNLTFKFNESLKPYLLQLKENFTQYRIRDVYQFKRATTWRLYEALRQWKRSSERKKEWTLDEFRDVVGVQGKYPRFVDLNKRVITPAVEDINNTSDIEVQWDRKKWGKEIIGVVFHIVKNRKTMEPGELIRDIAHDSLDNGLGPKEEAQAFFEILTLKYGIGESTAKGLANGCYYAGLLDKIDFAAIEKRWDKLPAPKKPLKAYLIGAINSELKQKGELV